MLKSLLPIALVSLLLAPRIGLAQTFSYDGNRWYEIEVSVFSNDDPDRNSERTIPAKTTLSYPDPILRLQPATAGFAIPFASNETSEDVRSGLGRESMMPPLLGPQLPAERGTFRLPDFRRDPYIALGDKYARFTAYNRDLTGSADHRLLFHAVWRQPVLNRVQATSILVTGGESLGGHYELEGSLRFSFNVNRVDVEADLWRTDVNAVAAQFSRPGASAWVLPPLPESEGENSPGPLPVPVLYYLNQTRSMISNDLHYLDHPAIGMLVEIRPYQLPELPAFSFD